MGDRRAVLMLLLILFPILSVFSSGVAFASSGNWVEVAGFGGGTTFDDTPPFMIEHVEWRIRWEYEKSLGDLTAFMFEVRVKDTDQIIGNWNNSGKMDITQGIYNITGYSGEFYIWIGTNGSHSVIVEQNLESIPEFPSGIMSLDEATQAVSERNYGERLTFRETLGELVGEPYPHDSGITAYLLWLARNGTIYQAKYSTGIILNPYKQTRTPENFSDSSYVWNLYYGYGERYWVEATNGTILYSTPQKIPFEDEEPFRLIIEPLIVLTIMIVIILIVAWILFGRNMNNSSKQSKNPFSKTELLPSYIQKTATN